jgi:phosphodiesterase/alkaline phosphatase D-like protein
MRDPLPKRVKGAWLVRAAMIPLGGILGGVALAADEIHWTLTGPTSVTFDWRGPDSTIRYGPSNEYGVTVTAVPPSPMLVSSAGPFWEARITGLLPGTEYHYSIEGGADHTFRTTPTPSQNFVVCVEGDVGDAVPYPPVAAVQAAIARDDPWFVLVVGDLTYADGRGPVAVDRHFNDVMAWILEAAYTPIWGNHEWDPTDDMSAEEVVSSSR